MQEMKKKSEGEKDRDCEIKNVFRNLSGLGEPEKTRNIARPVSPGSNSIASSSLWVVDQSYFAREICLFLFHFSRRGSVPAKIGQFSQIKWSKNVSLRGNFWNDRNVFLGFFLLGSLGVLISHEMDSASEN